MKARQRYSGLWWCAISAYGIDCGLSSFSFLSFASTSAAGSAANLRCFAASRTLSTSGST